MDEMHVKEVLSNEAFVKSIMELETPEEVQEALQKEGIDLSIDEIVTILNFLEKQIENDRELSEEDLESVAGGILPLLSAVAVTEIIKIILVSAGILSIAGATTDGVMSVLRRRW